MGRRPDRGAPPLGSGVVGLRCPLPHFAPVPLPAAGVQRARDPREILGLAGLLKMPEVVEVLAYARATLDPLASVALGRILLGPRYRVGFKDLALVASLAKTKSYAARGGRDRGRGDAVPVHRGPGAPRRGRGALGGGRARLEECRQELAGSRRGARRPSASSSARSSAGRHPHGARRPAGRGVGRGGATQPRGVPRRGPRVRAGPGRAHAPRVPRLRRCGGEPRQAGVVTGPAVRGRLGEGDDDPRREGTGVRPRLRARPREGPPAQHDDPAQPRRARQVDGLRAPRGRVVPPSLRGTSPRSRRTSRSRRSTRSGGPPTSR